MNTNKFHLDVGNEFEKIKDELIWFTYKRVKFQLSETKNLQDIAKDIVSEMLVKFFNRFENDVESLKKILSEGTLEGYFKTSIKNIIIDYQRKEIRRKTQTTDDFSLEVDNRPRADEALENSQDEGSYTNLTAILQKELPEEDYEIVSLYYLKNKKFREVGDILNINPNTIRTKMTSIRLKMYDICQKHNIKL